MKAPMGWMADFTAMPRDAHAFAEAMTMSGSKVEALETSGEGISGIATGRVESIARHPDADRLSVCAVDVGAHGRLQIVTGATNVVAGAVVPVALDGATLAGGKTIQRGSLRGVASDGMLCSIQELGFTKQDFPEAAEDGIWLLPASTPVGADLRDVLHLGGTTVDFEITSNRPDCLSIEGLAREAAATLGQPFAPAVPKVREEDPATTASLASVRIDAPDLCLRYCARVVRNVRIGPSPEWMRRRLREAGVRPIGNIIDITNYVMLELGQPMHAFDLADLAGRSIVVRRARDGESMKTLDGVDRRLDPSMLVIADAQRAVALAGVMGGENSEIHDGTTEILLESATFHGIRTRLTAKALGLRTESSARFEKGLDPANAPRALDRAAELIELLGCGTVCRGSIDVHPSPASPAPIAFRPDRINAFLGTAIDDAEMVRILETLGCRVDAAAGAPRTVVPPTFRADLESEADLAEEIARFHGYNRIPASLRCGDNPTVGGRTYAQRAVDAAKDAMVAMGFFETYTYSFGSPKQFDRLRLPEGHPLRRCVRILNPLGEDFGVLRTSLADSLLTVAALNANRGNPELRIFEISRTYRPKAREDDLPDEIPMLSAALYDVAAAPASPDPVLAMKGALEETCLRLGIRTPAFETLADDPSLHPGRAARVLVGGDDAGWLGTVHPDVAAAYEVPPSTVLMSVRMDLLTAASTARRTAKPLPRFPAMARDVALLVRAEVPAGTLEAAIREAAGPLLESVSLFDVYQGPQVKAGFKSMAFGLVFRSPDRTLVEEEVQAAMAAVLAALEKGTGAELRPA